MNNLLNQRFGRLLVIKKSLLRSGGHVVWECLCDCGNITQVSSQSLLRGATKSCGCLHKEYLQISNKQRSSLQINQKIGKLTIIKDLGFNKVGVKQRSNYLCKCDCGNTIILTGNVLQQENTISCGCLRSKGEMKITQLLQEYNIPFTKEQIFLDLVLSTGGLARFDFYIDNKYLIEYHGQQHYFAMNSGWNTNQQLKYIQQHDFEKEEYCKQHNIPLIIIPYSHYDQLNIQDLLLSTTQFLIN